jgi:hypothetical protein
MKKFNLFFISCFYMICFLFINICFACSSAINVIVQNPLIGRASGQFTNAIFAKNYQKNIVRSKPVQVMDAKTSLQLDQRSWFKDIENIIMNHLTFWKTNWQYQQKKISVASFCIKNKFKAGSELSGTVKRAVFSSSDLFMGNYRAPGVGNITRVDQYNADISVVIPTDKDGTKIPGTVYYFTYVPGTGLNRVIVSGNEILDESGAEHVIHVFCPLWDITDVIMFFYYMTNDSSDAYYDWLDEWNDQQLSPPKKGQTKWISSSVFDQIPAL